jgi:hypothetical protein
MRTITFRKGHSKKKHNLNLHKDLGWLAEGVHEGFKGPLAGVCAPLDYRLSYYWTEIFRGFAQSLQATSMIKS